MDSTATSKRRNELDHLKCTLPREFTEVSKHSNWPFNENSNRAGSGSEGSPVSVSVGVGER